MLTVRTRLTLSVLALITILVLALSLVETVQLRGFLLDSAATRLRAQAKSAVDNAAGSDLTTEDANALATALTTADTGALVVGPDGAILGRPADGTIGAASPLDIPIDAVARAAAGDLEVDVVRSRAQDRELLVLIPEPGSDPSRAVIVLSTSLADEDATARRQLLATASGLGLVLLLAAMVSPLLVGRSLRTLRLITRAAEQVATGDLRRRVRLPGPRDEIGRLADSFDTMTTSLESAFTEMARSEERSRAFVADASHELRTPLTTVGGFTDVLIRQSSGSGGDDSTRLLAGLRREVDRMQRIVGDLLLLARVDGGMTIDRAPVDVHQVAVAVADQVSTATDTHTLVVCGEPAIACTDSDRVHQVLLNLVGNAVRHTTPGCTVTITTLAFADRPVEIVVSDDGEGMDPQTRQVAFERFSSRGPRRGEGAGLGLAIVAALVRALGGQVQLRSAPGHGTSVHVTLPQQALQET